MKILNLNSLLLIILLFFSSQIITAQSLSCGFEFGAGASYIVEDTEENNQIDYSTSYISGINFKYAPKNSYFGIRANLMYVSTYFSGYFLNYQNYYGEVTTVTTSLLLEHLKDSSKLNFGYNFGLGFTHENYFSSSPNPLAPDVRNFMSVSLSGIVSYNVSECSSIMFTPMILWTDPINTFHSEEWYNGREDINIFLKLGYSYKLNKS